MRELELLATLASVHDPSYTYPKDAFDSMWQTILLCHFHDVIPGSAIEMVNDDASTVRYTFETYHNLC
jgi:alpha-mannosidase